MHSRLAKVQSEIDSETEFLVTNPINVRYLCGFTGSNGILLISSESAVLYTDARYELQVKEECFSVDIEITSDLLKAATDSFSSRTLEIEPTHITALSWQRLQNLLPNTEIKNSAFSIERLRVVKDESEIIKISQACAIAVAALEQVISRVRVGLTEKQVSRMLERKMVDLGADTIAFDTIVASGPNSAIAHHQPTERVLEAGDLLKIDFGAKLSGYHSDCTRTFVLGKASDWQTEIYHAVRSAQESSRSKVRAGALAQEVVQPTLVALESAGFLDRFRHGLSHGVGLEIHEDPYLSNELTATLEAGMVITIEPGVYLPGKGGVRIEDTIVVTETGYSNLTNFPYELQEIG